MRRNFLAGLFILLPFALTLLIVSLIINLLTAPFQNLASTLLDYYDILDRPFLFLSGEQMVAIFSKIFILLALLGIVFVIGFLGHLLFLTSILRISEKLIHKIPVINTIYKATQEITKTVFNTQATNFSQVVLVPFPNPQAYSIGLISQNKLSDTHTDTVHVFIPTAPNPTVGYMLAFKPANLVYINMKVDDAMKCIVSCGITFPKNLLWQLEIEEMTKND